MKNVFLCFLFSAVGMFCQAQIMINNSSWITDLAYAQSNPERVYKLDLSNQNLREVPEAIKQFVHLQELKLSDNKIIHLDNAFDGLKYLEFVELSGNWIQEIDFSIFSDSKDRLKELYLRDNQIYVIDSSINTLHALERLNLGNNRIESIDSNVALPQLISLYMDNNVISSELNFLRSSKKLSRLNVNNNRIEHLRIDADFGNLIRLDIGDNPIETLSFSPKRLKIEKLILDWIDLSTVKINHFPDRLIRLSMEHCSLENIPPAVLNLKQLRELSIMHNNFNRLEANLLTMRPLSRLWIAGNPIDRQALASIKKKKRLTIHMEEGDYK